jgi:hypothetical protein
MRGLPTSRVLVVLLHGNARPHAAARTRAPLYHFNWELFDHPPYSPDLVRRDYNLCTYLKNWLGSQRFNNNEELTEGVETAELEAADYFDTGIEKLSLRYDKCRNSVDDDTEKWLKCIRIFLYSNFFLTACFLNSSTKITFRIAFVLSSYLGLLRTISTIPCS